MARLIAPGVCRYSINGTFGTRPIANIWDMHIDSQNGSDRDENVEPVAAKILNAWVDNILPLVCNDYRFDSVSWVDLDSEDGTTGEITTGGDEVLPQNGQDVGAPFPGNVAIKVDKVINRTRGRRNGRMYICGFDEDWTAGGAPNEVLAAQRVILNAALAQFLTDVDEDVLQYTSNSVVVHTALPRDGQGNVIVGADPEFVGISTINSLFVDSQIATQRRRLR